MKEKIIRIIDVEFDELNKLLDNGWKIKNMTSSATPTNGCFSLYHSFCYVHLIKEN